MEPACRTKPPIKLGSTFRVASTLRPDASWICFKIAAASGSESNSARAVEFAAVAYNAGPRLLQSWLQGMGPLPAETAKYRDLVVGMWQERDQPQSPTYQAWREQLQQ